MSGHVRRSGEHNGTRWNCLRAAILTDENLKSISARGGVADGINPCAEAHIASHLFGDGFGERLNSTTKRTKRRRRAFPFAFGGARLHGPADHTAIFAFPLFERWKGGS